MSRSTFALASLPVAGALLGLTLLASSASAGGELLPLEPGMVVVTRAAQVGGVMSQFETVVVYDTRDPECSRGVETGVNWEPVADFNGMPNATMRMEDEWTVTNLGPIFGVTLDDADPPNIYVTTTPVYGTLDIADGRISRIDGLDGSITRITDLPNAGTDVGLGQICFDRVHQQLHVTNFEDGKLYRVAPDGTRLSEFDPLMPDDGTPGFAPMLERIWGVGAVGDRVYLGTWTHDGTRRTGPNNRVYSIAMDATGEYLPATFVEEFEIAPIVGRESMPVADIAFSSDGEIMIIGERSMNGDSGSGAHGSRVLSYERDGTGWILRPNRYSIGIADSGFFGNNSSGGIDIDQCVSDVDCPEEAPKAYATGDALIFNPLFAYGLQILPMDGGVVAESYVIDLDADLVSQDKTALGDVEVVRHAEDPGVINPPQFDVAWVKDPSACNLGLRIAWQEADFDPPGSGTYSVFRSTVSCADALMQAPLASGLTDLAWYDRDTEGAVPYYYVVVAVTPPSGGGCTAPGPPLTTEVCIEPPVMDSGLVPLPDVVWAVLRARHVRQEVTFYWDSVRPLLTAEHFHVLKAWNEASSAFSHINGEGEVGFQWVEEDTSAKLQFFDLRVANRCEEISPDEYPATYSRD